jgi:hypothetical protein
VRALVNIDEEGARGELVATAVPIGPLESILGRIGIEPGHATADLKANVSLDAAERDLPFDLDISAQGLTVNHPALDRVPWDDVAVRLRSTGAVDLSSSKLAVEAGDLEAFGVALTFRGWTEIATTPRGSWQVATRPGGVPCADLLVRQAAPVREVLNGLTLTGQLDGSASVTFDAEAWENLALDVQIERMCHVVAEPQALNRVLPTLLIGKAPTEFKTVADTGDGTDGPSSPFPLGSYHKDFTPLAAMPRHLLAAFVTAEDGRFYRHAGFDLETIRRALAHDIQVMSLARGASTITQQVAKNLFLSHQRTLARKLEEMVFAWRLAERLDKRRTLEIYLNLIELGPGIRGVKQAARAYFGKTPAELRPIESAHLAALTPNPRGFARRFRDGRVDDGWLHRLYDLLGMMRRSGRLSPSDLAEARAHKLALRKI